MSTRGLLGIVIDGKVKATYNHSDSYPEWLGVRVLGFARSLIESGSLDNARHSARKLRPTPKRKPTAAEFADLAAKGVADPNVSTGDDWYAALRNTQGDLTQILTAGRYEDSASFASDSLFCEWGYLVNLDDETIEVYRGYQEEPGVGRFADGVTRPPKEWRAQYKGDKFWYPISLIATYPLSALPTDAAFLAEVSPDEEAE